MKNRIAELRKLKGISQTELANAVEVIRQTITNLETYKCYPLLIAWRIAKYFDLSIEDVFLFDGGIMINVGDLVNHPNLGLCKVISIETIENEKRYLIQRQDELSPTRHEVSGNLISIM